MGQPPPAWPRPALTLAAERGLCRLPHPLAEAAALPTGGQRLGGGAGGGAGGVEGLHDPGGAVGRGAGVVVGVRVVVVVVGGAVGHGGGGGAPVEAVDGAGGRRRPLAIGAPVVAERGGVGRGPGRPGGLGAVEVHMVAAVVRVLRGTDEVLRRQVKPPRVPHRAGVHGPVLLQEVAHVHADGAPAAALHMLLGALAAARLLLPGAGLPGAGRGQAEGPRPRAALRAPPRSRSESNGRQSLHD